MIAAPRDDVIWLGDPATPFQRLWAEVRGKRVPPPTPAGLAAVTHADETDVVSERRDQSSAWVAILKYQDATGRQSERMVRCHRLHDYAGQGLNVIGWCYEREALREFKVERILELVDAHTGEVHDPLDRFDGLRRSGALGCDDRALTDLSRVLVFMARCDGSYHSLEQEAITHQLERYMLRFGGDDAALEAAVDGHRKLAPDGGDLVRAVKRFSRARDGARLCRFVLDSGAAIMDADGRHHEEELRWAVEMSDVLKRICDKAA